MEILTEGVGTRKIVICSSGPSIFVCLGNIGVGGE